ncbi:uncharacterized protein TNCV_2483831 [Trichonephila clavipes]|uniref:Uncharacterized protein n=1 Tax=Trichonephila clavipes TaxID=2585209 RepID=A0A8X7BB06_TRICX|nr:uncharacterized protein TNCV_2483831 [Trichonephila clavipes]
MKEVSRHSPDILLVFQISIIDGKTHPSQQGPIVRKRKIKQRKKRKLIVVQALATDTLSSYTHDYPTLPADVAEAIYPIYEDLSNVKLLKSGSKVVEIAAYITAGMFNEGAKSLSQFMSALGLSLGTAVHVYVDKEDADRVMISDARVQGNTREGRLAR